MTFKDYIQKFQEHYSNTPLSTDFLTYLEIHYDEATSYFPRVKLKPPFQTHEPWNGTCQAIRDIPEHYGAPYGHWILINDQGSTSSRAFPIDWLDIEPVNT